MEINNNDNEKIAKSQFLDEKTRDSMTTLSSGEDSGGTSEVSLMSEDMLFKDVVVQALSYK